MSVDEVMARRKARSRFVVTALGLLVVGMAGYLGFVAFVGSDRTAGVGVIMLAAATGFAAFFSPCSSPLLLTFLTRRTVDSPGAALVSALRVAAGAALFLVVVAAVIAAGVSAVGSAIAFDSAAGRVFRLGIGLAVIAFGLRQARLWGVRMRWLDRVSGASAQVFDPARISSPPRSDLVYGFGYLLAGFG